MSVRDPAVLECKEVVELVTELLENALAPDDRARIEQHLLVCPPCTLHVAQVKATVAHVATLRAGEGSVAASSALVDVFREWKKKKVGDDQA